MKDKEGGEMALLKSITKKTGGSQGSTLEERKIDTTQCNVERRTVSTRPGEGEPLFFVLKNGMVLFMPSPLIVFHNDCVLEFKLQYFGSGNVDYASTTRW